MEEKSLFDICIDKCGDWLNSLPFFDKNQPENVG
jgi:hypothetical protein